MASTLLSSPQPLPTQQPATTSTQEHQQEAHHCDHELLTNRPQRPSQVNLSGAHSNTSVTLEGHQSSPQGLTDPSQQTVCTQFLLNRLTQLEDSGLKCQGLPIRYRDLSVFSSKIDHEIVESLPWAIYRSLIRPLVLVHKLWVLSSSSLWSSKSNDRQPSGNQAQIPILSNIDGIINQSELLLVLARPRGGMTSLLRAISLNHESFSAVTGHLDFGSLPSERLESVGLKPLVTMIEEYDEHLPSLNVQNTLGLAAKCRTPRSRPHWMSRAEWARSEVLNWSKVFRLSSTTLETYIGSEAIRGVSGGERRRVSIIEGLLTRCAVICLDNATAGLDSANSYHLVKSLKEWCKVDRTSAAIGLRQASDGLYNLFDKVSVLHEGHQIYFGPTSEAVQYFQELGFLHSPNQPIADFLCSVTDPSTAKARSDPAHEVPHTPAEFIAAFRRSKHFFNLNLEMIQYDSRYPSSGAAQHIIYSVPAEKDAFVRARSPWTSNYFRQLAYLTSRQYALIRADLRPYITKTMINLVLSVIIGTLFYQLPKTTEAAFSRGSVLFLSVLFNGYLQLSELGNTLMGRQITQRHGKFGLYSPGALALARTLGDIPLITAQVLMFASITYGLAGLQRDPVRFGIYILLVDATAINLTAVFRMLAAVSSTFDEAMRYCGVVLNLFVIFGGYFIPTPSMGSKLKWIRYYLDPISHAFDAVLSNEFHGLELSCSPQHIVPRGPSYTDPTYQTCSTLGSRPNSLVVSGDDYLFQSYGFEYRHLWYNLGMIIGSSVIILVLSVFFTEYLCFTKFGSTRLFRNSASVRKRLRWMKKTLQRDGESTEEGIVVDRQTLSERMQLANKVCSPDEEPSDPAQFESAVLTFRELKLCVKDRIQPRILLNEVAGYFQPGELTALMGESGSGKTTLLNALAGRASYAHMSGELLLDGRLPTADSYRSIGYVEQTDCHDEYATVREALELSALLRQPKSIPRWAKLADVDRIIGWLGLKELEDAIIGTPSAGLCLEDRKKLSIAVELVARPKILCLDEPVSGMDSQSATHIIQLLRRLASQFNLTVVVTVHQPSVEIFESFDRLILLQKGGNLAYFGPRDRAVAYFEAQSSRQYTSIEHPAEYLIDSMRKSHEEQDRIIDGVVLSEWRSSSEHQATVERIEQLNSEAFSLDQSIFNNQRGGVIYTEIKELTKRFSRHFWRDSSFGFTQIFTATAVSVLIGLSFFQQASSSSSFSTARPLSVLMDSTRKTSLMGLQNQVFSVFLILFLPPVFMNQLIAKWFQFKSIYETREKLSGSYREISLVIGFFLAELPYSILSGLIFWTIWFFCLGFRIELESIGFSLLAVQLFFFFQMTWAIWIAALAPTIGIVANLLPFFLVSMEAFNGSLLPYDQMPKYWRWMYWVSPFQWYVKSVLSMVLHGQIVTCQPGESVQFLAPNSTSCEEYSREFIRAHSGYLMSAIDISEQAQTTQSCGYCGYSTGDEFLSDRFKTNFEQSYQSLKVFGIYCLVNFLLIFLFIIPKSGGISRFNLAKNLKTIHHNRS
ncbi:ATP-binding cassette transporter snq2 [Puccinia graminis f. sp. tritici]|uniref:ATP-binding cassette transporter snq2 n=1 Tax=Puccinia graminis f. sp. tritici TaxID=56615 RepID=A0A5B0MFH4_PUCGR|nr:ATP-binding cassette transporter snq2 [Puccinia graminis f. sp. tritici]KAA1125379.1 ATP-binding cassette transporter snq2 [Puccinia graminis f. sp. tritici]